MNRRKGGGEGGEERNTQTLQYYLLFRKKALYYLSCSANNTDTHTCTEQRVLNDKFTNSNVDPVRL